MLKAKDRELANAQSMINILKKENANLRGKLETETGMDRMINLEGKLSEAEKRN